MTVQPSPEFLMSTEAPKSPATEKTGLRPEAERKCLACGVTLSRYNPGPNCWQHTIGHPWQGPTAKPRY